MNPVIKRELEKVRAPLPEYDDNTTLIKIMREAPSEPKFIEGAWYLCSLEDYILNEPPTFTLSSNWNNGVIPTSKFVKLQVARVMGKMIQVHAFGYDEKLNKDKDDKYVGLWLPSVSVTVIQKI